MKKMSKKIFWIGLWTMLLSLGVQAQETPNAKQARRIFDEVYQKVFGNQGASLHYKVDVASIYKTEGTIWYKGKKSKYLSASSKSWNDGVVAYVVKDKKKTVEMFDANSSKQSRFGDDFKFEPENYTYQIENVDEGILITLRGKKGVKAMKEIRALLDKTTRDPVSVRIKVAFIWANVLISNLKSGNLKDEVFTFPRSQYRNYKFIDRRGE